MDDAWYMMHDAQCNPLVYLIFVRTVNKQNISLLPCLEVAWDFFGHTHNEQTKQMGKAINWGSMLPKNELFSSSKIDQVRAFFHKSFKQAEAEVVPSLSSGILKLS